MIRSILAVLAGIAALTLTSFAIEFVANTVMMQLLPPRLIAYPSIGQRLFLLFYTQLCVAFGGYVTAWIAKRAAVLHAVIMGAVMVALTIRQMVVSPRPAPLWTWVAGIMMLIPFAWCGGALRAGTSQKACLASAKITG